MEHHSASCVFTLVSVDVQPNPYPPGCVQFQQHASLVASQNAAELQARLAPQVQPEEVQFDVFLSKTQGKLGLVIGRSELPHRALCVHGFDTSGPKTSAGLVRRLLFQRHINSLKLVC